MTLASPSAKPCPKCRSAPPVGAAFCPVCGLQILDVCWDCGEPLQGDWAYCPRCGTNASETGVVPCPSCREPVGRARRYCPNCGAEARPLCSQCGETLRREWRFCPECGTAAGEGEAPEPAAAAPDESVEAALPGTPHPRVAASPQASEAAALNQQGAEAYEADRIEDAIRLFRQAASLDPANADYHTNLAVALDQNEEDAEAAVEYRRAIELNPRQTIALLNLGYLLSEEERYAEAREAWEQVIRIDPQSPEAKEARESLQHLDEL